MQKKLPKYQVSDLGCAAALVSAGCELSSLDKSNPRRVLFEFDDTDMAQSVSGKYWSDDLLVKARTLMDSVKMLKARIYSE